MKFSVGFAMLALPLLATASPLVERGNPPSTTCDQGSMQCCNSVQTAGSPQAASLLGLLGLVGMISADTPVGLTCTPISVIGTGNAGCSKQTVCCTGNSFNGLINIGCTPIMVTA